MTKESKEKSRIATFSKKLLEEIDLIAAKYKESSGQLNKETELELWGLAETAVKLSANDNESGPLIKLLDIDKAQISNLRKPFRQEASWSNRNFNTPLLFMLLSEYASGESVNIDKTVSILVEAGAYVNDSRNHINLSTTPLHSAAKIGSTKLVDYLLAHGADARAIDRDGNTPIDYAVQSFYEQPGMPSSKVIAKLIFAADDTTDKTKNRAMKDKTIEILNTPELYIVNHEVKWLKLLHSEKPDAKVKNAKADNLQLKEDIIRSKL